MSKILTKMVKKTTALTAVFSAIIAIAIALAIVFGVKGYGVFNKSVVLDDANTLTVSVSQYTYLTNVEAVEDVCEDVFGDLKYSYKMMGEMTGDESEIVYVFKSGVDLTQVEADLEAKFAELTKEGAAFDGAFIKVASNSEATVEVVAKNYALRGVIAAVVIVAAVYIYAAIRFGIGKGVLAAIGTFASMALTAAVIICTRIPVTTSVSYVMATAGMLGAVISMLALNKIKMAEKAEEEMAADELVVSSLATKEVAPISAIVTIALIALAAIAPMSVKWFALSAFVGVIMATIVGLVFVPSMYIPMKTKADGQPKPGYVGAKKTSTKEKKSFVKAAPVVEEVKPVEEAPVEEETTEEVVEETVEEAPVEETVEESNDQE